MTYLQTSNCLRPPLAVCGLTNLTHLSTNQLQFLF